MARTKFEVFPTILALQTLACISFVLAVFLISMRESPKYSDTMPANSGVCPSNQMTASSMCVNCAGAGPPPVSWTFHFRSFAFATNIHV